MNNLTLDSQLQKVETQLHKKSTAYGYLQTMGYNYVIYGYIALKCRELLSDIQQNVLASF